MSNEYTDEDGKEYIYSNIIVEPKLTREDIAKRQDKLNKIGFSQYLDILIKQHVKKHMAYCEVCGDYYYKTQLKNNKPYPHRESKEHLTNYHYYKICREC